MLHGPRKDSYGQKQMVRMTSRREIDLWWHGIAALPSGRHDHAYYALRRVWGDHTMAGARGFYRIGTEDNITLALFQNWALFPDTRWVPALVQAAGGTTGRVARVRWAYACEEELDTRLQPYHKREFVVPDIVLAYEDQDGLGLLTFEVKVPGKATEQQDGRKLKTYVDLPSTRKIPRRYGCVLVSEAKAEASRQACGGEWPTLTWEQLGTLQIESALAMDIPSEIREQVADWL